MSKNLCVVCMKGRKKLYPQQCYNSKTSHCHLVNGSGILMNEILKWNSYIPHISPSLMAVYNSILNPSMNVKDRRPDHNTENYVPYSFQQCVGSLTSHKVIMDKGCETWPTIYRPYPRRLDSLTICRYHYKGSTFSSVILRTWVLVRPGFERATSRTRVRYSTNWANRSAVCN